MKYKREFIGEASGTFLLVLFGCGAGAVSVLFNVFKSLPQIALIWGIGVTLAIYLTRHLSCAHLNPAVSIAMVVSKRMIINKLPVYLLAQFTGAFLAGLVILLLFSPSISAYEKVHNILRGSTESIQTAKIFGEYYIGAGSSAVVSLPLAMGAEAFGAFILLTVIFALTEGCNVGRPDNKISPIFIGLTVAALICILAPLTQAGFNPARDFGPRMVSWMAGWGDAAFPDNSGGFFLVYVLAPIVGAAIASLFFVFVLEPAMNQKEKRCGCNKEYNNNLNNS